MSVWFTSDPHFFHKNVIRYCRRPFSSVEEMNEKLISNWNAVVKPEDHVFVLGDFAFCGVSKMKAVLDRLNGIKYLVPGNHDASRTQMERAGFKVLEPNISYILYGKKVNLSHYPYAPGKLAQFFYRLKNFWKFWRRKKYMELRYLDRRPIDDGRWLLHGHVHNSWKIKGRQFNVGVDVHNYRPVNAKEIAAMIGEREGNL